ncbi:MAG: hypothetical protein K8T20_05390 [Planctomycetes bacterium]|nr:hypothetical protein [Planctomycetota bacterium]
MTAVTGPEKFPAARRARSMRRAAWPAAFLALCAVSLLGGISLSSRISAARAENAALAARLELTERGRLAVEAVRADLQGALAIYRDDETGRAWMSRCVFPVNAAPAGGARLPHEGPASILLVVRPVAAIAFADPDGIRREARLVRLVAWYPAESPESPALASWESVPLADAAALAALPANARVSAVEALLHAGVALAWDEHSPAERGLRPLDVLTGDVAPEPRGDSWIAGTAMRWCGENSESPVLSRGLGHPAFSVTFSGPAEARRAEIRLTIELRAVGSGEPRRLESVAVASGLKP